MIRFATSWCAGCPKAAASSHGGQDQGSCNWVGRVADVPRHELTECGMVEVEGKHSSCTAKFMWSEIAPHEGCCDCRTLPCALCQELRTFVPTFLPTFVLTLFV
eukprot:2046905-Rhodomonas_salina.3